MNAAHNHPRDSLCLLTSCPKAGYDKGYAAGLAAIRAETPATRTDALDVERLADDVRYASGGGTSDYWRGYNDGIDALVARLATPPETKS